MIPDTESLIGSLLTAFTELVVASLDEAQLA